MLFGVAVIGNSNQQQIVSVLCHLGGIFPAFDLFDGSVNGLGVFQLNDDGRRIDILTRSVVVRR